MPEPRKLVLPLAVVTFIAGLAGVGGGPAGAAATTVVVNDAGDALHSPGCAVSGTGNCTLRDAITFTNANAGHDTVQFNISGAGVRTIAPASALPPLSDVTGTTIDGYTQPGAAVSSAAAGTNAVLIVELRGAGLAGVDGIELASSGNVVRGLAIGGFSPGASAIAVTAGSGNAVTGNFIGTNAAGTAAVANGTGITVGGAATGTTIGGALASSRNLVAGNGPGHGILIEDTATSTLLQNNVLGLKSDGVTAMPNGGWGVLIAGAAGDNTIGPGNVIASNVLGGVAVTGTGMGNAIQGNSIFANAGPGIDLGANGTTTNDAGDADTGPNGLQNAPAMAMALRSPVTGNLAVGVAQDSRLAAGVNHIDVYVAETGTAVRGPGKTHVLAFDVAAGDSTTTTGSLIPLAPVGATAWLTATATTLDGTSEFALNVPVQANTPPGANAGANQTLPVNSVVTLNGSASVDPDGLPSAAAIPGGSFTWTQTAGIPVALTGATTANPSFQAVFGGFYVFSLVVHDGLDISANVATVTITITDTTTPVALPQSLTTRSNQAKAVHLSATDPDNTKFIWTIATQPAHGAIDGFNDRTGGLIYVPFPGYQGTDSFTVTASDGINTSAPATITMTIRGFVGITTAAVLPAAFKGGPYSVAIAAASGTPPYAWTASPGLPPGVSLNPATGVLSGVPTAAGTYMFTITVHDAAAEADAREFTLVVAATSPRPHRVFLPGATRN